MLNEAFRFGRREIGASVTGTGRQITKHMGETIGTILSGEQCEFLKRYAYNPKTGKKIKGALVSKAYRDEDKTFFDKLPDRQFEMDLDDDDDDPDEKDSNGAVWYTWNKSIIYGDTDSVDCKSQIRTSIGNYSIEDLFSVLPEKWNHGEKEFATLKYLKSICFDGGKLSNKSVHAVYRHKVKKPKWKITLADGKSVIVTDDHSIMVMRNDKLIEVKPGDINRDTDMCISIGNNNGGM
ncbi:Hint domain-containing protein [Acinetobacter sp.]|uniref:Hint domain-containing protein n=1 Tax=Acinetobacter sp. TaxID=472 RepID=UPI0038901440